MGPVVLYLQGSAAMWKKTGIIALREANLIEVPSEVWQTGSSAQSADFSGNSLQYLPVQMANMSRLTRLTLSKNSFQQKHIEVGALSSMTQLRTLSLSQNRHALLSGCGQMPL